MRLGHVHLKVKNLERAVDFYSALLGLKITESIPNHFAFLTFGEAHHDLALQQIGEHAERPSDSTVGLYHSAFEVEDSAALTGIAQALKSKGIPFSAVDHGISQAIYTSDPDGNGVEVYLDTRHSAEGRQEWHGSSKMLKLPV